MSTTIGLIPVCCVFVIFCWYECAVSMFRLSPKHRLPIAIGLIRIHCILIAIESFICHAPTAISLAPVHHKMGTHLFFHLLPPCLHPGGFFCAEPLGFLRVHFALNVKDADSALFMISGSPSLWHWISFSIRPIPWLGLIP